MADPFLPCQLSASSHATSPPPNTRKLWHFGMCYVEPDQGDVFPRLSFPTFLSHKHADPTISQFPLLALLPPPTTHLPTQCSASSRREQTPGMHCPHPRLSYAPWHNGALLLVSLKRMEFALAGRVPMQRTVGTAQPLTECYTLKMLSW